VAASVSEWSETTPCAFNKAYFNASSSVFPHRYPNHRLNKIEELRVPFGFMASSTNIRVCEPQVLM